MRIIHAVTPYTLLIYTARSSSVTTSAVVVSPTATWAPDDPSPSSSSSSSPSSSCLERKPRVPSVNRRARVPHRVRVRERRDVRGEK